MNDTKTALIGFIAFIIGCLTVGIITYTIFSLFENFTYTPFDWLISWVMFPTASLIITGAFSGAYSQSGNKDT